MNRVDISEILNIALGAIVDKTDRTNADRVQEAEALVMLMNVMTGVDLREEDGKISYSAISDTICHLMHLAHANGVDWAAAASLAEINFNEELEEESV